MRCFLCDALLTSTKAPNVCESCSADSLADACARLHAVCGAIPGLTVHGVGVGDGALYVYCRAKHNAQQRIPKKFEEHTVKYVLCKAMPGGKR